MSIRWRIYSTVLFLFTVILLTSPSATAQTGAASLTGIVSDQSGSTVPGATVTATNQATNVTYVAVSNEAGNYTVTSLPVGTYVVKAELSNFKTAATKPIQVEAMQIVRIDFKLELGALQETVEVSSDSQVLQTESATVGEVISGSTLSALPLNGRNTGQLSLLLPGVVTPNPSSFTAIRNFGSGRPFVNGNREQTNNYTIDGVDMNETIDNLVAYQPSPDALAEISVETNNYAADTGNVAGAVISNVIKSGTNSFHGNAFEFYRNSSMDANSWSNNRSSAPKPERRQDIYGGTFGGPLVKSKLFFFGNYQGTRFDAPGFETISVAPATWRAGDLSSLTAAVRDPVTGVAFPGNQVPLARISPIARAILSNTSLYPLPNRVVTGVTGNYVGETLTTIRAHQADVRADWNASANDKIFGRFSYAEYESTNNKRAFPLLLGNLTDAPFRNLAFNWNRIVSSAFVNELLVGYNQITIVSDTLDWGGIGDANATFGIAGGQPIAGLSSIALGNGLTSIGAGASDTDTLDKTYQINEKLTWLKGRHTLKSGGQFLHYVQQRFYAGNNGLLGLFGYGGAFTNAPFADFLLDQVTSKGRGSSAEPWTHQHNRIALFVQDDFKMTQALTLNLGLRWAYTQPVVEKDNRQGNFDLSNGQEILAADGDRESRSLYKSYKKGFEPRLGFAWRPGDRWVLRGGYGISQYMEGTGANLRLPLNPPFFFESAVQYDATTGAGTLATGFAELVPGIVPSGQVRAWDPNLRPQFTQQWNVFAEYLLTSSMSANVGYVGHKADHLVAPVEGNQPLAGRWRSVHLGAAQHPAAALRDRPAHHQHRDDRGARPQRLQRVAGEPPPAQHEGARVPGVVHARARADEQPRLLRFGRCGRRRCVLDEHLRAGVELWTGLLRRPPQPGLLGQLRGSLRPWPHLWLGRLTRRGCDSRRLAAERHLPGAHRVPHHRDRWEQPVAAGCSRQRAAELHRRSGAVRPVHRPLAGHQRLRARSAGDLGQLRHRRGARARLQEHRSRAGQALQRWRRTRLRVPRRGVQPDEHAQLRSTGPGHQRAEHVRPDHEHGQHRADS